MRIREPIAQPPDRAAGVRREGTQAQVWVDGAPEDELIHDDQPGPVRTESCPRWGDASQPRPNSKRRASRPTSPLECCFLPLTRTWLKGPPRRMDRTLAAHPCVPVVRR